MRSLACFALVVAAPLAFATGCSKPPPTTAADYAYNGPPIGWRDPSLGKETRSGAMVVTGAVVVSIAATMLPIGSVMAASGRQDCITDPTGSTLTCTPSAGIRSGLGVLIAAAGGLAVGIPLMVLGAQKVPVEIPRRAAVVLTPGGAALRYDF
ncbi:MAG: hypothetical protein ABJE95_24725 [Byssovorax sp.]